MNFLGLLSLALAPGIAIGIYVYLKDKHEREPIGLLLMSFLYGGLSTVVTLLVSWPLTANVTIDESSLLDQFFNAFFLVALVEETSKFLFVRFVLYPNKNFNEPFDGIVYALMVSMGFATLENVLYTFQYGATTGVLRMFTAVPAHATFGILMGYFLGKAKFTHQRGLYYALVALFVATLFHGAYDYFWFINYVPGVWVGAILSLVLGVWLSKKAIRLHQFNSPFTKKNSDPSSKVS
jgi:RsiW-degrading membrane proteinase PrsW (M82 family)